MEGWLELIREYFILIVPAACFIIALGLRTLTNIAGAACREKTRREIAAYIAEGSITPEQGERLIRAEVGRPSVP